MSNKLYVGNLSFRVTSEDLQEYFGAAGAVESANVVYDRETGRSRGFGFVEMADEDAATAAISQFNGQEYDGRNLVVKEIKSHVNTSEWNSIADNRITLTTCQPGSWDKEKKEYTQRFVVILEPQS